MKLSINGQLHSVSQSQGRKRLVDFLRDDLGLVGTRHGCGMGLCGACTVHLNRLPVRSCQLLLEQIGDKRITTIEGLSTQKNPHPLQKSFIKLQVPQCGFCMSGQIMSASALLYEKPKPNVKEVNAAMVGNLCRCGTYTRIRKAILMAAGEKQ